VKPSFSNIRVIFDIIHSLTTVLYNINSITQIYLREFYVSNNQVYVLLNAMQDFSLDLLCRTRYFRSNLNVGVSDNLFNYFRQSVPLLFKVAGNE